MGTVLLVAFLMAHGLVHAAIWLPHTEPDPKKPAPFAPDHSPLLVATSVPQAISRRLAVSLALGCGAAYLLAGLGVALDTPWAASAAGAAAIVGLILKLTFFNPWLTLGLCLDAAALASAAFGWPVSLA